MAEIKLTKNELRFQQLRLGQLNKYLPTLQLKKAMLQAEVNEARLEILAVTKEYETQYEKVESFSALLSDESAFDPDQAVKVKEIHKRYENIAGVEVPYFDSLDFEPFHYSLFESPPWFDALIRELRHLISAQEKINVAREKKAALEKELREVSIRVNLFEKILIPRALKNIKKIKVFLGDQELSAVAQAKVAKEKIEKKKELEKMKQGAPHAN